ncbi:MAG: lipid-A-disaccharide synthase [Idiomarina sp.]|nr:lipid-A-disaccharide synthase [Idiomarina sp.]
MATAVKVVALVAGEASGDILGASLMRALKAQAAQVQFIGVGGPLMQAEGLDSLFPLDRLSVMGIVDVVKQLPDLLRARRQVIDAMLDAQPDVFVGIDAPDFNIPIEAKLKQAGIVTVHYVSPSVWAWRQKRVFKIAKATDNVLCLLPFEKQFYDRYNVPATFVGHTLADEIPLQNDAKAARERLGLNPDTRYIGLLPGSRRGEVALLAPVFLAAAAELQQRHTSLEFLLPVVNADRRQQVQQALAQMQLPADVKVHLIDRQSRDVMLASEAVLLASGTVALEAMLLKRPMVVAYRFGPVNYQILRHFVKLEHFSLPNLIAGEALVPELLQDEVTAAALADHIENFISAPQDTLIHRFTSLHQQIQQDAASQAAKAIFQTHARVRAVSSI